jgi:hypothetical protein
MHQRGMPKCRQCNASDSLTPEHMARYKYQLAVDGHGTSYDGTVWKLLSQSVVFFVNPAESEHAFDAFYYPLLQPNKHFVRSTVASLRDDVQWCVARDAQCARIATAARARMAQLLHPDFMLHYIELLLMHVHRWYTDAEPV